MVNHNFTTATSSPALAEPSVFSTPPTSTAQMPLTQARRGQAVRLLHIGTTHHRARRLAELGLTPGVHLEIVQDAGGSLLVAVRQTRLALRRSIAQTLLVEPLAS